MQVPHVIQECLLVGGISDKSLFEINIRIKVMNSWMLMRKDPLLKFLYMAFFFKRQDKGGWTIFKKYHPQKLHNMTSIAFIIFAPAHDLNNCVEMKACGQYTMLELCCHRSREGIVLQADAAQMGKCSDRLESGMSTSCIPMDFAWFHPIQWWEIFTMGDYQPEWNSSNFTRKSVRARSGIWMAWVHWYKGRKDNRNHHQALALQFLHLQMI